MNKTHSFSTKTLADLDFIEELKRSARNRGRNFSWLVITALRQYEGNSSGNIEQCETNSPGKTKDGEQTKNRF